MKNKRGGEKMQQDQWGYSVTSEEPDAVEALNQAFNGYFQFRTDAMKNLDASIEADPDFALPHAGKGILLESLKKPELHHAAHNELEAAKKAQTPTTAREHHYIAALEAALAGQVTTAVTHYQQIAIDHPHDLFAIRLAQSELFWIGEVAWMRDISESVAPHWAADVPGYSSYLSIRSFGLEENGDYNLAEKYGRQAVDLDPTDCWGAHAVAHVLVMQGRLDDGISWLSELNGNWSAANHMAHHLWWHLALFYTEHGDYDAGLDIYDQRLRDLDSPLMQAMPDFYVDIQNDTALLQRLELRGIDIGDRWQPIAELAKARIGNHYSPFTSAHCALALAAADRFDEAKELVRHIREFIAVDVGPLGPRYALAVLPASEAAVAHRKGEHQRVIDILMPARRNLWQMGGSHAQRDLFFQLLVDSAVKLGRRDILDLLLSELGAIGFDHLTERSSYADAVALSD
jgi:tetratricopeptide (TPR) repeat protein